MAIKSSAIFALEISQFAKNIAEIISKEFLVLFELNPLSVFESLT